MRSVVVVNGAADGYRLPQQNKNADGIDYLFMDRPNPKQARQIIKLYRMAGWWAAHDSTQLVERIISGSYCFLTATHDDEIIGMGRVISDGVSDAYIQDVTVRKDYRGMGIGSRIVTKLTSWLESRGIRWIGLIAEGGSGRFYRQLGFKPMPNADPMVKLF